MDDILSAIPAAADTGLLLDALCDADANTSGALGDLRARVFVTPSGAIIHEGVL